MLSLAVSVLADAGYGRYEISNFALPGHRCRHNLLYWRGEEYLGLGAGAHSHLRPSGGSGACRWSNVRNPQHYMALVQRGIRPVAAREVLGAAQVADESLLMGLRLSEGISLDDLHRSTGLGPDPEVMAELERDGFLEVDGRRLRLGGEGLFVADAVIERLCRSLTPRAAPRSRVPHHAGGGAVRRAGRSSGPPPPPRMKQAGSRPDG